MYLHGLGVVLACGVTEGLGVREQIAGIVEIAPVVYCAVSTEETRRVSINLYIGP